MGRTRSSKTGTRPTPPGKELQAKAKSANAKAKPSDSSHINTSDNSKLSPSGDGHDRMIQNGLPEETGVNRSSGAGQKRQGSPQTEEIKSQTSKRRKIRSKVYPQESSAKITKSRSQKSSKGSRANLRSRLPKCSKAGRCSQDHASSPELELKSPKQKGEQEVKSEGDGHDSCKDSVPESDGGHIAVKSELKEEAGGKLKSEVAAQQSPVVNIAKEGKKLVGAHCSVAGGLHNAVEEAVALGGHAFGLFLRSSRTWAAKPLDPQAALKFRAACKEHGFAPGSILPHGSYLMNCGSPNPDTLRKSRETLLDELQRCEALGLTLYNFHPGSTCGQMSVDQCLDKIADAINWAHQHTKSVITVVENMSCQGNTVGGRFEELKGIIDRVMDKARIGICLDTCHAFAAGFDLSTKEGFEKFVADFDTIVGLQYLKAMHLNDSKGEVGCHMDRHENIGKGKIGLEGFQRVMAEPRFNGIPMILETPVGHYANEIRILYDLIK